MMLAATAAADFTPKLGLVLQGHAGSPPSHTVLYPLEVRSIVFADGDCKAGICTIDIIGVEKDLTQRVRQRVTEACGIAGDHIMIATSHTHCAPAAIRSLGMTCDPDYMAALEDAMVNTLVDAASRLEPVTLGLGCGSAAFNINRRPLAVVPGEDPANMALNYGGVVDRRARLLRIDKSGGSPLAVLFHYSCHPTAKGGGQGKISPDYPGIARRRIEEKLNCHALFMPGCFGNIRPGLMNPETGGFADATDEQLDACGHELGNAVMHAAQYTRTFEANGIKANLLDIDMQFEAPLPMDELKIMAAGNSTTTNPLLSAPWAKHVIELIEQNAMPTSESSQMQAMRIGPLQCITIPGECVQEIGHDIEKTIAPKLDCDDVWAMGYTNDMLGYITTQRHKIEGGYEPNAYVYFGRPARFHGEQDTIVSAAKSLVSV